jgi:hypothetical protein
LQRGRLTGTVKSYAEKRKAERAAWAAPGAYRVGDRISVARQRSALEPADAEFWVE